MKKILIILFLILNLFILNIAKAAFEIKARTAILQDYLSGEILYEKDADLEIFPASMPKIMTTIIAFDLVLDFLDTPLIDLCFKTLDHVILLFTSIGDILMYIILQLTTHVSRSNSFITWFKT